MRGRKYSFWPGVPCLINTGPISITPKSLMRVQPKRSSSSIRMRWRIAVRPMPPYSFGQAGATQPFCDSMWYQKLLSR